MIDLTVNGRFFSQPTTGVQRYAREILAELDLLIQDDRIEFAFSREWKRCSSSWFGCPYIVCVQGQASGWNGRSMGSIRLAIRETRRIAKSWQSRANICV